MSRVDQDTMLAAVVANKITETWAGIRFHHGGRVPQEATDALVDRIITEFDADRLRQRIVERLSR